MIDYQEDYEYASQRLPGTVVRMAHGIPVYVNHVDIENKKVLIWPLTDAAKRKEVKLRDLDVSSPPLGFVNYNRNAIFVMRIPRRRDWKQGLRAANCFCTHAKDMPGKRLPGFDNLLNGESLHNCILGNYPKLKDILESAEFKIRKGFENVSVAWDRHWAVSPSRDVFYKNWGEVGVLESKGDILFKEGYAFLRESFEESVL